MLKEIELSNGKKVRVIEAEGYNDKYYWDMTATVEIDGVEYYVQDAGSGSGYTPMYESVSVSGPCKLTGAELEKIEDTGEEKCFRDWNYIFNAIKDNVERFFSLGAKKSYEYCEDTYGHVELKIDGVLQELGEEED